MSKAARESEKKEAQYYWGLVVIQLQKRNNDNIMNVYEACLWLMANIRQAKAVPGFNWPTIIQAAHLLNFKQGRAGFNFDQLLLKVYQDALKMGATVEDFLLSYKTLDADIDGAFILTPFDPDFGNKRSLLEIVAVHWIATDKKNLEDVFKAVNLLLSKINPSDRVAAQTTLTILVVQSWISAVNAKRVLEILSLLKAAGAVMADAREGERNLLNLVLLVWRILKVPAEDIKAAIHFLIEEKVNPKSPGDMKSSPLHLLAETFVRFYKVHEIKEMIELFFPTGSDPNHLLAITDLSQRTPLLALVKTWLDAKVSSTQIFDIAVKMIRWGADVNATDRNGATIVHYIAMSRAIMLSTTEGRELLSLLKERKFDFEGHKLSDLLAEPQSQSVAAASRQQVNRIEVSNVASQLQVNRTEVSNQVIADWQRLISKESTPVVQSGAFHSLCTHIDTTQPELILRSLVALIMSDNLNNSQICQLLAAYDLTGFFSDQPFKLATSAKKSTQSQPGFWSALLNDLAETADVDMKFHLDQPWVYLVIVDYTAAEFNSLKVRITSGTASENECRLLQLSKQLYQATCLQPSPIPAFLLTTIFRERLKQLSELSLLKSESDHDFKQPKF